jgi:hypothetical protein
MSKFKVGDKVYAYYSKHIIAEVIEVDDKNEMLLLEYSDKSKGWKHWNRYTKLTKLEKALK